MYYKIFGMVSGQTIIAKVTTEEETYVTMEHPMVVNLDKFDDEGRVKFAYVPWQLIAESPQVDVNTTSIMYSGAPKTELLNAYLSICTQFERARYAPKPSPQEVEDQLNNAELETN